MYKGPIVDTHMHLWDRKNGYAWFNNFPKGMPDIFFPKDYLQMSQNQPITHMVHVECGGFPNDPVQETAWIQKFFDEYGFPHAIAAFIPLHLPEAESMIKRHLQYPNLRSIRMALNFVAGAFGAERDDYMRDAEWQKGYALLSKYQLPFEMQIYDTQLQDATALARKFPESTIILEHLGWPQIATKEHLPIWKERMETLAECQNVYLKLSCLGWVFQTKEESLILAYIKEAIKIFGVDRCMVGSNCPPDTIFLSFDEIFELLRKALASLSQVEQEKIFYSNAKKLYLI